MVCSDRRRFTRSTTRRSVPPGLRLSTTWRTAGPRVPTASACALPGFQQCEHLSRFLGVHDVLPGGEGALEQWLRFIRLTVLRVRETEVCQVGWILWILREAF